MSVVVVLRGDEYPEHETRDRGQTAHSLMFVAYGGAPPRGQRCEVCSAVAPDPSDERPNRDYRAYVMQPVKPLAGGRQARHARPQPELPPELVELARRGADACPTLGLLLGERRR